MWYKMATIKNIKMINIHFHVAHDTFNTFVSLVFEEPEDVSSRSFFSEIIASISDVRFSRNGRYILSRDYLTVKLWDVTMESRPVEVYPVHDYLRSRLCSLYENDCIFDKFECGFNGDDRYVFVTLNGLKRYWLTVVVSKN